MKGPKGGRFSGLELGERGKKAVLEEMLDD